MAGPEASRSSAVTIGAYDGVHVGHRMVIETLRRRALEHGLRSVVVTFDRHPAAVVRPESAPKLLTDLDQKLELLQGLGVDDVEVIRFDERRATETAEEFVEDVLVGQLSTRLVVVGSDFHFGKGRGGNVALLEEMGGTRGFEVVPFRLVEDEAHHETVSSTRIRRLLQEGELEEAASLLARPHEVRGGVVAESSDRVTVGVSSELLLPKPGAYEATLDGEPGVAEVLSAGVRTYEGAGTTSRVVERQLVSVTAPDRRPEQGSTVRVAFLRPKQSPS